MASSNGPMNSPFELIPKVVNKKNYYTFVSPSLPTLPYAQAHQQSVYFAPTEHLPHLSVSCNMIQCPKESMNGKSGRTGTMVCSLDAHHR